MTDCKRCEKYRKHLRNIVKETRACLRDFNADRDTAEAYARLRREGERIDRMLQREDAREAKRA